MAPSFCDDHRQPCGPHTVVSQMKACGLYCCSVLRRSVLGRRFPFLIHWNIPPHTKEQWFPPEQPSPVRREAWASKPRRRSTLFLESGCAAWLSLGPASTPAVE